MRRRVPALVTLVPVAALIGGYSIYWDGKREAFRADLARALPGVSFEVGGFPYRLSAGGGAIERSWGADGARVSARGAAWSLDRQPWRQELSVIGARRPVVELTADGLGALLIEADKGRASVNRNEQRVSSEFEAATIWLRGPGRGEAAAPLRAERFELHVRQTPQSDAPGPAPRAQVYVRAAGLRLRPGAAAGTPAGAPGADGGKLTVAPRGAATDGGDPLAAELALTLRSPLPLIRAPRAVSATSERFVVTAPGGEVANGSLQLAPAPEGGLAVSGTIATTCPRQWAELLGGAPAARPEYRARLPVTLSFAGPLAAPRLASPLPAVIPARTREKPCPQFAG
ncbi:MAG: hypothetical protein RQ833_03010 [Sphingomonadaceae bacterium]|nr:hypothetical protein [Sphingomonadaceae bacterium]